MDHNLWSEIVSMNTLTVVGKAILDQNMGIPGMVPVDIPDMVPIPAGTDQILLIYF